MKNHWTEITKTAKGSLCYRIYIFFIQQTKAYKGYQPPDRAGCPAVDELLFDLLLIVFGIKVLSAARADTVAEGRIGPR